MALPAGTRERQLKRWSAQKKLALIAGDVKSLHSLAQTDEGTPMGAQARVVERYTVNQDGSRLDYTVSVTDPPNLVKPAVWDAHWSRVPGTVIRPFECELK